MKMVHQSMLKVAQKVNPNSNQTDNEFDHWMFAIKGFQDDAESADQRECQLFG